MQIRFVGKLLFPPTDPQHQSPQLCVRRVVHIADGAVPAADDNLVLYHLPLNANRTPRRQPQQLRAQCPAVLSLERPVHKLVAIQFSRFRVSVADHAVGS